MIRSSFQPIASAIIEIDSASPTCRTLPSSTLRLELLARQAGADLLLERQPADARVLDAIDARCASTRSQTPVSVIGSASIAKPGLTPVPSTATFAFFASCVNLRARSACCAWSGYASSSVVETIGTFSFRIASICGSTFFSDELVHSTTTSGFAALIAFVASSGHLDAQRAADADDLAEIAADLGADRCRPRRRS